MRKIDWKAVKEHYIRHSFMTYAEVANNMGLSHIAVRVRGSKEKWRSMRQEVRKAADKKLMKYIRDQIVERHIKEMKRTA